jgi:hypothetical protein
MQQRLVTAASCVRLLAHRDEFTGREVGIDRVDFTEERGCEGVRPLLRADLNADDRGEVLAQGAWLSPSLPPDQSDSRLAS